MSYKNKIQLSNFNNNNLNMIKITSNTVYNSNYDYKKKFKTEICHFWEMNGDFNMVITEHLHMENQN